MNVSWFTHRVWWWCKPNAAIFGLCRNRSIEGTRDGTPSPTYDLYLILYTTVRVIDAPQTFCCRETGLTLDIHPSLPATSRVLQPSPRLRRQPYWVQLRKEKRRGIGLKSATQTGRNTTWIRWPRNGSSRPRTASRSTRQSDHLSLCSVRRAEYCRLYIYISFQ